MTGLLLDPLPGTSSANNPMQWAVLAFGILTILYITVIRPMRKGKSRPDPLAPKPTKSTLAQQRAIERDMGNLLVQYEEMIRRMTAQVDIRATKLELLIQEAEAKIAQLKALTGSTGSQASSTSSPQGVSAQGSVSESDPPAISLVPGEAPQPTLIATPPATGGNGTVASDPRKPPVEPGAVKADERHAEIYRLADGGRTTGQIAQELSRPYGEVELILHLRSPKPRQGDLWEQPAAAGLESTPVQAEAFNPPEPPVAAGGGRRKGRKNSARREREGCETDAKEQD